ncbi:AAA family ATPase [Krasilnikoviella flava]|uniref:AAA domain-containing protein n=1 Tax=Krasilnikoviella flava TaxID=526729 RepID=A0A1T5L576_9MICO|nr:AAA family ATPase [Krasilnikoviella flava]SKC71197.1 AAA domain-containing protein [Krasilnikoviella flava]
MTAVVRERTTGRSAEEATFVLVGGVPGAGKSTALAWVAALLPRARVLDSEAARRDLRGRVPRGVPYAVYRPVVHARHLAGVARAVLAGPPDGAHGDGAGVLVVHDPATSRARRWWWAFLARRAGWRPVLVMVDAERAEALSGQEARGRLVRARAFARHWRRWAAQRAGLVAASGGSAGGWSQVLVVGRQEAVGALLGVVVEAAPVPVRDAR